MSDATIRRILIASWRDLEHPDAGGSELHVANIAKEWAARGIDVTLRTGSVPGLPPITTRDGYRVERRGGPHGIFLRTPMGRTGDADALLEVWHGISFLAPLWSRVPTAAIAHHVHGDQFRQVLPLPLARVAEVLERFGGLPARVAMVDPEGARCVAATEPSWVS